jgi:hypothetical protein
MLLVARPKENIGYGFRIGCPFGERICRNFLRGYSRLQVSPVQREALLRESGRRRAYR